MTNAKYLLLGSANFLEPITGGQHCEINCKKVKNIFEGIKTTSVM